MNNFIVNTTFILATFVTIPAVMAESFIPTSNDSIIATWPAQDVALLSDADANSLAKALKVSEDLLKRATQPGRSYLYGLAKTILSPWVKSDENNNASLWVNWARIQQQQHDFDGALLSLETALQYEPKNINAHLIMARTLVILQKFDQAKESCSQLLASNDFLAASICNLEVTSHQGQIAENYDSLQKLLSGLRDNDPKKAWVLASLADMAVRQKRWQKAEAWLDASFSDNDISVIIEWADVKLTLKKYQEVNSQLSAIVSRAPTSEDAILIRLAKAEKKLAQLEPKSSTDTALPWLEQVSKRVALRELRQDTYHASDLAIYYLDLKLDVKKALYWAEVNWEQAKEYKDEALLMRAKLAAEIKTSSFRPTLIEHKPGQRPDSNS